MAETTIEARARVRAIHATLSPNGKPLPEEEITAVLDAVKRIGPPSVERAIKINRILRHCPSWTA